MRPAVRGTRFRPPCHGAGNELVQTVASAFERKPVRSESAPSLPSVLRTILVGASAALGAGGPALEAVPLPRPLTLHTQDPVLAGTELQPLRGPDWHPDRRGPHWLTEAPTPAPDDPLQHVFTVLGFAVVALAAGTTYCRCELKPPHPEPAEIPLEVLPPETP